MDTVVAQDIFYSKLDAIFYAMKGLTGITDDIIIYGKDEQEHDKYLLSFMETCMKHKLTLYGEKIYFE